MKAGIKYRTGIELPLILHPLPLFSAVDLDLSYPVRRRTVPNHVVFLRRCPGHRAGAFFERHLSSPDPGPLSAASVRSPPAEIHAPQGQLVGRLQATFPVRLDRGGAIRSLKPHRLQNSAIGTLPFSIEQAMELYLYSESSWLIPFLFLSRCEGRGINPVPQCSPSQTIRIAAPCHSRRYQITAPKFRNLR